MGKAACCVLGRAMCLLLCLALPVIGLLSGSRKSRRLRQRHDRAQAYLRAHLSQKGMTLTQLREEAPEAGVQAAAIARLGGCPLWYGGQSQWFSEGEECFRAMLRDLRQAEKSIWLECFIIRPGVMWEEILNVLRSKAAQGVDVRVIYDGFGCHPGLPRGYPKLLQQMRIRCHVLNSFGWPFFAGFGGRDHRKLMLIDSKICYTGGIDLSDACIGLRQRCGNRKEGTIRIEGEAVHSFSVLFLSMWTALGGTEEPPPPKPAAGKAHYCYLQPFWDAPLQTESVGRSAVTNLIARAQESIWLMTPSLVPDAALCRDLRLAAASGLDVKIIIPGIGRKWYTRSHWAKLLEAGVELFEYVPGILHTEFCCADGQTAIVGTGNPKHPGPCQQYENGIWLYGRSVVEEIREDFVTTLEKCRPIAPAVRKNRNASTWTDVQV